jgi:predicted ATPase with chaperone activity
MSQYNLSARGCHRVLKLARTLGKSRRAGDFGYAGSDQIQSVHLAEALHLQQAEVDVGVAYISEISTNESGKNNQIIPGAL